MDALSSIGKREEAPPPPAAAASAAGPAAMDDAQAKPYMDGLEKELRASVERKGAKVVRAGNQLIVIVPSPTAFDSGKDDLKRGAAPMIAAVGAIAKKYDKTTLDVYGHTDAGGDEKQNQELTQRRALAVARGLAKGGLDAKRLSVTGFGSTRPLDPATAEQTGFRNPRIEIQFNPVGAG